MTVKEQGKTGEYIEISFNIGIYRNAECDDASGINEKIPCTELTDILSNPAYRGLFDNQSVDTIFGLDKGQFEVLKINWRRNTQSSSAGINTYSEKLDYKYNRVFAINFSNKNQLTFDAQGAQLKKAIDDIASITGVNKFNLIGHSMGGLAARAYIQNESTKDIQSLITVDTPHLGGIAAGIYVAPTKNAAVNLHKDSLALKNLNENTGGKYNGIKVWHLGYSDNTKLKNGNRFYNGSDGNVKIYSQMGLDSLSPHRVIFSPDTGHGVKAYGEAYTFKDDLPLKYADDVFTSANYLESPLGGAHVKVLSDETYIQYVLDILK